LTYAADNNLSANLFSLLQYTQLALAFLIRYFLENEKFPLSRMIYVALFVASILFTQKMSQKKPVDKDKRKIIINSTLFYSERKKNLI